MRDGLRKRALVSLLATMVVMQASVARAETPESPLPKVNHLRIAASMLSGAQAWTDYRIVGDYRLQHRPGTELWRLMGPREWSEAKGTRAVCEMRLAKKSPPAADDRPCVVLVHGLFQTRAKMESLERYLTEVGGYRVVNFGYASTRADIEMHAAALGEVLRDAPQEAEVSFVGHSMGCIVIRQLLANQQPRGWTPKRVVMIGAPNQGAEMARRLSGNDFVRTMLGPGFDQLAGARGRGVGALAAPSCEFALIAGESPRWMLNNPLIDGDDDWIVGVGETELSGAKQRLRVDAHHGAMVHQGLVLKSTLEFLKSGKMTAEGKDPK